MESQASGDIQKTREARTPVLSVSVVILDLLRFRY